jgi:hypothetical protein
MGANRNAYRILVGRPKGKRHYYRSGDNIKLDLCGRGWGGMDLNNLAQGRYKWLTLVDRAMNLKFHKTLGNSGGSGVSHSFMS